MSKPDAGTRALDTVTAGRYKIFVAEENLKAREKELLTYNVSEYVTSIGRALLGATPLAGPALAELITVIVPNQRFDRVVRYAVILEGKIGHIEAAFIRTQLSDQNFTGLLEDSVIQAARAVTEERLTYIASVIANGLSQESIRFSESRHILRILGEMSDVEVLWLRWHTVTVMEGDHEFRDKHADVLNVPFPSPDCSEEVSAKNALKESYIQHLVQVGLIEDYFPPGTQTVTGGRAPALRRLTRMGHLLLQQIGPIN